MSICQKAETCIIALTKIRKEKAKHYEKVEEEKKTKRRYHERDKVPFYLLFLVNMNDKS